MKWRIETRATWKGDRDQTLAVLCRGIHQFKSNSRGLNIWTRISLGKCSMPRLLAYKKGLSLQIAGKTVITANPKWSETLLSRPRFGASLWEVGLKLDWEESLSPSWLDQSWGWCATRCSSHLRCTHAFHHAQDSSISLWILCGSLCPFSGPAPDTQQKGFICTMLYTKVIASDKFNRVQVSGAYAGHGPHYFKASILLFSYGIQTKTCQILVCF